MSENQASQDLHQLLKDQCQQQVTTLQNQADKCFVVEIAFQRIRERYPNGRSLAVICGSTNIRMDHLKPSVGRGHLRRPQMRYDSCNLSFVETGSEPPPIFVGLPVVGRLPL